ncbi:Nitrous oxide reductase maturation protein NosD [hydrothermal vent metagenome]|uniref:Nitrous oxide reductase maturation protein NosD n=1 Tax=hydrothermal vent metagenome TaxID=652676 RepID=A0A3B0X734_9ZZZZ
MLWFLFLISSALYAKEIKIAPGNGTLQLAIDTAHAGDTLQLTTGTYKGSINIHRSLSLHGNKKSIIDGDGSAHVITVSAKNVLIKDLTIQHSGNDLNAENSGIFITDKGDNARIESNHLKNNLIGIYLKGPENVMVNNNQIIGSQNHRINDRGNGIYLWNTPGSVIKNNSIRYGRDGIFVTSSRNNIFSGNQIRDLRFAVHYMYTHDSEVSANISSHNHVGFALMFSDRITVKKNQSVGDLERGFFFNFANYSVIEGNRVSGDKQRNSAKKCVFIYNANFNQINHNLFENCQIGIHFTAGSERNDVYANAFINNRTQVKYVGTRFIEWSKNGVGNYWSDNISFDIDANGIADQVYRPNDLVDQIVWRHPMARLLLNSPAVKVLKWAQSEFPGIHPGGVTDSAPLMRPPDATTSPYTLQRNLSDG